MKQDSPALPAGYRNYAGGFNSIITTTVSGGLPLNGPQPLHGIVTSIMATSLLTGATAIKRAGKSIQVSKRLTMKFIKPSNT